MDLNNLRLEKFVGFGSKSSKKISVTKSYSFGIPPKFYAENNIENCDFAEVYYDPSNKAVALHFVKDKTDACFKLIKYGENEKRGASFVAKSFFTRYDLEPKRVSGKYEPEKISRDGIGELFVIQLQDHPISEGRVAKENAQPPTI